MKYTVSRLTLWISAVMVLVALGLNITRVVRQYDEIGGVYERQTMGLFDFHNGVYTPTQAFISGINPYGQVVLDRGYPMARPSPSYGPSHFLIHAPLAMLPLRAAEILYLGITCVLYFLIIAVPVSELLRGETEASTWIWQRRNFWFYCFAGLFGLLTSRPGHVNFVTGYFTAELVLGTIATLFLARRHPLWAGCAFVLACGKPTYALPLVCVLLVMGFYRAMFASVCIGGLFNLAALGWLLRGDSLAGFLASVREGQSQHMADPIETPAVSWLRIDWTAVISKWMYWNPSEIVQVAVMFALYLGVWILVVTTARKDGARLNLGTSGEKPFITTAIGTLCLCSVLLFIYHHVYDAILLAPVVVALALNGIPWTKSLANPTRLAVLALFSSPFWNYFSSETVLMHLPDSIWLRNFVTSWNCFAVTFAAMLIWRSARQEVRQNSRPKAELGFQADT